MLLFSTLLDITDEVTEESFLQLVRKWNETQIRPENIVPDVDWEHMENKRYGTEKLSLELTHYQEHILAVRHEKIDEKGVMWDTDFIVNLADRKISIRLDRTFSEEALKPNADFSTPHFITLLVEAGFLKDDLDIPVTRDPIVISDDWKETLQHYLSQSTDYQLPLVYVARTNEGEDPLDIALLASRLKGAAHVLVEKSKAECGQCIALAGESPEDLGAVRIYYPVEGMKRKLYHYRKASGSREQRLKCAIQEVISFWIIQRVPEMYSWIGVKGAVAQSHSRQHFFRYLRADEARHTAEQETQEFIDSFDEELKKKEADFDKLARANMALEAEIQGLRKKLAMVDDIPLLIQGEEEDFFDGEIRDIILEILEKAYHDSQTGTRRKDVLEDVLQANKYQKLNKERREKVKKLLNGYHELSSNQMNELIGMGFCITGEGKHYKIYYGDDTRYIATMPKTPSDNRSGMNTALEIGNVFM